MTTRDPRLTPRDGKLYTVRWIRQGNRPDVRHKHFTRGHDAHQYADKLRRFGKDAEVYVTDTRWQPDGAR
ncbi:hypothetical protein [Nocardioides massiliensis]|uniref:Uncharacterized protein n=1 Tax=Nocardioides massiliensis TaxID=1325935 RepID=A0ABT9NJ18_9ACTN|nr:hypothetical protein [Nocardioides massiliensis]MDP9820406.1 hypothetical protein [Nocardioides massiliensis]